MAISVRTAVKNAVAALTGQSIYLQPPPNGADLDLNSTRVEELRERLGGQLEPLPITKTRWLLADLEQAQNLADQGQMRLVGQLSRWMRRDGMYAGLLKTRTSGLLALPRRFRGDPAIIADLTAESGTRSLFDEMFPPSELALLAGDGIVAGVGVAELVPVPGRPHPVMVRHEPEFLWYRPNEGRWYYQSIAGLLPITPGDGRWILHTPGGALTPWQWGLWNTLGRAVITKEHALLHRANFSGKLANPARVAKAVHGASEDQRKGFLQKLIGWGVNTAFELPPGWDVALLESNGRGWEVFGEETEQSNLEIMISLAGQVVTVTGGTGFANAGIHETIRADLIKETADSLAHTINTQGIPPWEAKVYGIDSLKNTVRVDWDINPPEDRLATANALTAGAAAVNAWGELLAKHDVALDVRELSARFGVPILIGKDEAATIEAFKPEPPPTEGPPGKGPPTDPQAKGEP